MRRLCSFGQGTGALPLIHKIESKLAIQVDVLISEDGVRYTTDSCGQPCNAASLRNYREQRFVVSDARPGSTARMCAVIEGETFRAAKQGKAGTLEGAHSKP
jgi:hypothetical protein